MYVTHFPTYDIKTISEERLPQPPDSLTRPVGTGTLLVTGQSKAKMRIIGFLTVFVMTGILSKLFQMCTHNKPI